MSNKEPLDSFICGKFTLLRNSANLGQFYGKVFVFPLGVPAGRLGCTRPPAVGLYAPVLRSDALARTSAAIPHANTR
jgi:hypothetical protein